MANLICATAVALTITHAAWAAEDTRLLVTMPEIMEAHMPGNMRDHLKTITDIQTPLAADELDRAADIAETRLGMTSQASHDAAHRHRICPRQCRT